MKKDNKKALYESIMTSVAKEVKKALNEDENISNEDNLRNEDIKTTGYQIGTLLQKRDWDLVDKLIDLIKNANEDEMKLFIKSLRNARNRVINQISNSNY